jgi:hypothetical protein
MDQTGPPLDVHRLYGDRHRQHRGLIPGTRKAAASSLDNLLATAPALPAPVHWSVPVRAALYHEVAQQARTTTFMKLRSLDALPIEINHNLRVSEVAIEMEARGGRRRDQPRHSGRKTVSLSSLTIWPSVTG